MCSMKLNKLFISFLGLLCLISILPASQRNEQNRLISVENSSGGYDGPWWFGYHTLFTYHYQPDNPELIDSLGYYAYETESYDTLWVNRWTCDYSGSSYNANGLKRIEYYYYQHAAFEDDLYKHCYYELDNLGRTVHVFSANWNSAINDFSATNEIYRHFNNLGYADSILFVRDGNLNEYDKRFFENSMLQSSIRYIKSSNGWTPFHKFTYTYSENPTQFPNFIRFDTISQLRADIFLEFERAFNPRYLPDSITRYEFENNVWVSQGTSLYSTHISDGHLVLGASGDGSLYVDNEGNITYYIYPVEGVSFGGGSCSYIWDTIVSNEDDVIPITNHFLKAYPNPFRNNLTINIDSKDTYPADISIYNIKGQLIRQWKTGKISELVWDGKDAAHQTVSSGIYLLKSRQGKQSVTAKVIKL